MQNKYGMYVPVPYLLYLNLMTVWGVDSAYTVFLKNYCTSFDLVCFTGLYPTKSTGQSSKLKVY